MLESVSFKDLLQALVTAAILGLVGIIWRLVLKDIALAHARISKVKDEIAAHEKECNTLPKILIAERLNNLCEKQDEYQEANIKSFDKLDKRLDKTDEVIEKLKQQRPLALKPQY